MIKSCEKCASPFDADMEWKTHCKRCYAKKKQAESGGTRFGQDKPAQVITVMTPIPDDMLMRLIRLCHPDRHNNNEASNTATQWLLSVRDQQRRAA